MKKRYSGYNRADAFITCALYIIPSTSMVTSVIVFAPIFFSMDPLGSILGFGIGAWGLIWSCFVLLPRMAAQLYIIDDRIFILKAPFKKTIKMSIDDCEYIGVEDSKRLGPNSPYSKFIAEHDRGDMYSYIYLSTDPYPDKYAHKAEIAPCKDGFIKIKYNDKLCLALLEILPPNKSGGLRSFYIQMQLHDKMYIEAKEKRKKEKAKRKLKKQQEKAKRKKD